MQITLNIKDEKEFLAEIKEIVRGQVKQLAREESQALMTEEMKRSIETRAKGLSDYSFKDSIKDVIRDKIKHHLGSEWYSEAYIKKEADVLIKDITQKELRNLKVIETAEKMIKDTVDKIKSELLKKLLDK